MKRLITDLYTVLYKFTGNKLISIAIVVLYFSAINLVTIYGFSYLLKDWTPGMETVNELFSFPLIIMLIPIMTALNLWILTPLKNLSKEKRKHPFITPIIVYSMVAFVLLLYTRFSEKMF